MASWIVNHLSPEEVTHTTLRNLINDIKYIMY